jgi:arginyl-tRNA synthetase
MEERIRDIIAKALLERGAGGVSFAVEWPADLTHGDFAVNAAMAAAKTLGVNPKQLADALAEELLESLGADAGSVEVAGPGFINVTLSRPYLAKQLGDAVAKGEDFGKGEANLGQRVMIEYSNPNPFKQMHLGHLMGTVIGEAVSRVIANTGANVLRDSYGGDVGPHVAKTLWAFRNDGITDVESAAQVDAEYAKGAAAYEENENAKAEIDTLNNEIYASAANPSSNPELMNLWQKCREACLEAFRDIYRVLGTHFDYYFFESETTPIGMEIVQGALEKGIFEESDDAVIYTGEKKGLHTLVFITSRGTPTYETKDVGLAFLKEDRAETDEVIIVTGTEQIGHFKVFLAALEDIAPLLAKKTNHVAHGLLRLTTGKMSSRKGNVITAQELIEDVIAAASEKNEDPLVAEQVAVGAIKYMVLRQAPGGDVIFDPETSLSLDGDSGPYLQYAYVRAKSILAQAGSQPRGRIHDVPAEPYLIERLITRLPEVAARAGRERSPHYIAQYLTQLAGEWNSFYAANRIIGGEHESYKLGIAQAFALTMHNGLQLLGIPTPEKM